MKGICVRVNGIASLWAILLVLFALTSGVFGQADAPGETGASLIGAEIASIKAEEKPVALSPEERKALMDVLREQNAGFEGGVMIYSVLRIGETVLNEDGSEGEWVPAAAFLPEGFDEDLFMAGVASMYAEPSFLLDGILSDDEVERVRSLSFRPSEMVTVGRPVPQKTADGKTVMMGIYRFVAPLQMFAFDASGMETHEFVRYTAAPDGRIVFAEVVKRVFHPEKRGHELITRENPGETRPLSASKRIATRQHCWSTLEGRLVAWQFGLGIDPVPIFRHKPIGQELKDWEQLSWILGPDAMSVFADKNILRKGGRDPDTAYLDLRDGAATPGGDAALRPHSIGVSARKFGTENTQCVLVESWMEKPAGEWDEDTPWPVVPEKARMVIKLIGGKATKIVNAEYDYDLLLLKPFAGIESAVLAEKKTRVFDGSPQPGIYFGDMVAKKWGVQGEKFLPVPDTPKEETPELSPVEKFNKLFDAAEEYSRVNGGDPERRMEKRKAALSALPDDPDCRSKALGMEMLIGFTKDDDEVRKAVFAHILSEYGDDFADDIRILEAKIKLAKMYVSTEEFDRADALFLEAYDTPLESVRMPEKNSFPYSKIKRSNNVSIDEQRKIRVGGLKKEAVGALFGYRMGRREHFSFIGIDIFMKRMAARYAGDERFLGGMEMYRAIVSKKIKEALDKEFEALDKEFSELSLEVIQ